MITVNTTIQLKASLSGDTKSVPFRSYGKVVAVYEQAKVYRVKFPQGEFDVPGDQVEVADPHRCTPESVPQFKKWLRTRGGLAIWNSANLSNPAKSWTCPVNDDNGRPKGKPSWEAGEIIRIITDPSEVIVDTPKEVKRFHVAIKRGDSFNFTLTAASSRKLRAACDKAGENSWYEFDYSSQEAIIFVPGSSTPINEWAATPVPSNLAVN
jgi:hypothetical protein